jgi:hypothetical protein
MAPRPGVGRSKTREQIFTDSLSGTAKPDNPKSAQPSIGDVFLLEEQTSLENCAVVAMFYLSVAKA